MSDATHLLALEMIAIDTDLQWRQVKAQRFIELIDDDELHPIAYKRLDADEELIGLERTARKAKTEAKVAWNRVTNEQKVRHIASMPDQRAPGGFGSFPSPDQKRSPDTDA